MLSVPTSQIFTIFASFLYYCISPFHGILTHILCNDKFLYCQWFCFVVHINKRLKTSKLYNNIVLFTSGYAENPFWWQSKPVFKNCSEQHNLLKQHYLTISSIFVFTITFKLLAIMLYFSILFHCILFHVFVSIFHATYTNILIQILIFN
jgi:hypothetical protein